MPTISTAVRNAACDASVDLVDGGTGAGSLLIYSGSAPAGPTTAPAGTLLVTIPLNATSFGAAAAGVATLDVTGGLDAAAAATGTAGFARLANGDGTGVMDLSVSDTGGGGEVKLASTSISSGVTVEVTSGTVTMPAS